MTAEARVSDLHSAPAGLIRIAAPLSFGITELQPSLNAFMARYPEVRIDLDLDDRRVLPPRMVQVMLGLPGPLQKPPDPVGVPEEADARVGNLAMVVGVLDEVEVLPVDELAVDPDLRADDDRVGINPEHELGG